ncbi:MAG: hypothetical protein ACE5IJ_08460 [Thermoplasmata archaeon]
MREQSTATVLITFSKPMNRASVEAVIVLEPYRPFHGGIRERPAASLILEGPVVAEAIHVRVTESTATASRGPL